jgi:hypothetical protein
MNHHLHSAYPVQQPPSRGRRPERRDRSPSLSLSPTRSRSSSISLDELLEVTDNKRASPSSPQPAHAYAGPPSYYRPVSTRHSRSPDYRSSHTIRRDTAPQPNVVSPAVTSTAQPLPQPPLSPSPTVSIRRYKFTFCPSCNWPTRKKAEGQWQGTFIFYKLPMLIVPSRRHPGVCSPFSSFCGWSGQSTVSSPWRVPRYK